MYCPHCGTQASTEQKFCRACGLSLQAITQILSGAPWPAQPDTTLLETIERFQSRRHKMLRRGFIIMGLGIMAGIFLEIISGALSHIDRGVGRLIEDLSGIGALVCLIGIGVMIYSRFFPKATIPRQSTHSTPVPQATPPVKLPSERRPHSTPSVTEHTTELLRGSEEEPAVRTTARQRE